MFKMLLTNSSGISSNRKSARMALSNCSDGVIQKSAVWFPKSISSYMRLSISRCPVPLSSRPFRSRLNCSAASVQRSFTLITPSVIRVLAVTEAVVLPSVMFTRIAAVAAGRRSPVLSSEWSIYGMEASNARSDWRESDFSTIVTSLISNPILSMMAWMGLPFISCISACRSGKTRLSVSNSVRSCNETMDCTNVVSVTTSSTGCTSSTSRSTCIGLCASMVSPCVTIYNDVVVSVVKSRFR